MKHIHTYTILEAPLSWIVIVSFYVRSRFNNLHIVGNNNNNNHHNNDNNNTNNSRNGNNIMVNCTELFCQSIIYLILILVICCCGCWYSADAFSKCSHPTLFVGHFNEWMYNKHGIMWRLIETRYQASSGALSFIFLNKLHSIRW